MKKWLTPFHIAAYYAVWFTCIFSAAANKPWIGPLTTLVITSSQISLQKKYFNTKGILPFIAIQVTLGILTDTVLLHTGLIYFSANPWPIVTSPPWMISLWVSFATLSFCCLKQFFSHYLMAGALSALGFPLAYYTGMQLGAATSDLRFLCFTTLSLLTGLGIPCALYIFNKIGYKS